MTTIARKGQLIMEQRQTIIATKSVGISSGEITKRESVSENYFLPIKNPLRISDREGMLQTQSYILFGGQLSGSLQLVFLAAHMTTVSTTAY